MATVLPDLTAAFLTVGRFLAADVALRLADFAASLSSSSVMCISGAWSMRTGSKPRRAVAWDADMPACLCCGEVPIASSRSPWLKATFLPVASSLRVLAFFASRLIIAIADFEGRAAGWGTGDFAALLLVALTVVFFFLMGDDVTDLTFDGDPF